ncbi:hypothetical protein ACVWZA_002199 [Sphingomonas sp. UYAg733]
MNEKFVGSVLAIPTNGGAVLAKVIFASSYFADVVAIKLYPGAIANSGSMVGDTESRPFEVYFTSGSALRSKRWKVLGQVEITDGERKLTKRTAGGEVWIEDKHLGIADDNQLAELPKMLVHGPKLIEKYAARTIEFGYPPNR